jgi:hypothetical protein
MTIFFPIPVRFLEVSNRFLKQKGLKKTDVQVPASLFAKIIDDVERKRLKALYISHLAGSSNKWMKKINVLLGNSDIKIEITELNATDDKKEHAADGDKKEHVADGDKKVYMAHIKCKRDSLLISLAKKLKEFSFSFPRGFAMLFDDKKIIGTAPFYPKFDNDDKDSFESVEKGEFTIGSFFVKYSGSLAKVAIWKGKDGQIYWTVTSKNSADSTSESGEDGVNYVKEMTAVLAPYMTQDRLRAIYASGVRSFCAEVMLKRDNVHGYRVIDGFIVTAASTTGRFLDSKQLAEWCRKIGLPTDCPLQINGKKEILEFIKELRNHRDVMTVDLLQKILKKNGLQYDLSKHRTIVQSPVLEGFIITLRNAKGEKLVLKYKFAFYTAVTMFLREYIRSKTNTKPTAKPFVVEAEISKFLGRWVFDKSVAMQSLWSWILRQMVHVADTQTFEGPVASWIQASERIYARVFAALAENGNNIAETCKILDCPEVRFVDPKSRPKGTIIVIVGYFGSSKSTLGNLIAEEIGGKHFDCDGCEKGVWMKTSSVRKLSNNRNMVTVAEILKLVSQGHRVVVSSGGGNIPNLKEKAAQLGFDLDIIVMAPENLGLYDDKSHIESLIKYRASLLGSTWSVKNIGVYFEGSQFNKKFAEAFITEAESSSSPVFSYPQMRTPEDAAKFVSQTADELKALMQTTLTLQKVKCQRQQQNVVFDRDFASAKFDRATTLGMQMYDSTVEDKLKGKLPQFMKGNDFAGTPAHITLMFNEKLAELAIMQPHIPVGESREVTVSFCVAEVPEGIMSGTTLAPFVVVFIGGKSYHITLDSGTFTPASMKNVAQAYLSGKDTAVFETKPDYTKATEKTPAVNKPSQKLTCKFAVVATSKTSITGLNVIALN